MKREIRKFSHSYSTVARLATIGVTVLAMSGALSQQAAATSIGLGGGTTEIGLDAGSPKPIFTFKNDTNMIMYDLLLSTNDSDLIDPDFEGSITVRAFPGGTNLGWTQSAQGDGVEDVKIQAADDSGKIDIGSEFTVEMEFDDVAAGDRLKVTPTNKTGHQIQSSAAQSSTNQYNLFNGYDGLDGSLRLAYAGVNGLGASISSISFSSPTPGVSIVVAQSSLPSLFDPSTAILHFDTPIFPGSQLDYFVSISALAPFNSNDPDPFTKVLARANTIPEPSSGMLVLIGFTGISAGRAIRRIRTKD